MSDNSVHVNEWEIKCPHCHYEHQDSWECFLNGTEWKKMFCDSCNQTFWAIQQIIVTYDSQIKTPRGEAGGE